MHLKRSIGPPGFVGMAIVLTIAAIAIVTSFAIAATAAPVAEPSESGSTNSEMSPITSATAPFNVMQEVGTSTCDLVVSEPSVACCEANGVANPEVKPEGDRCESDLSVAYIFCVQDRYTAARHGDDRATAFTWFLMVPAA